VPWYLISHPSGNVVIDGGNAPAVAADPVAHLGAELTEVWWPRMTPAQAVLPELERIDMSPSSVRWILQSHLHVDHTGAVSVAERLPNAQVLVTRKEFEYAHHPDWFMKNSYIKADFNDPRINWVLLEDSDDGYDVFGDGVLRCWQSPGHSPGHQSFTVTLRDSGTFLLVGDAAYTMDHWNEKALPGGMTSALEVARSVRKLRRIASRERATVVTGHDPEEWPAFKLAPLFYT
jgi:glyoxylase-like metal-dependent hydrolase (beta-lactamase superfamily II)